MVLRNKKARIIALSVVAAAAVGLGSTKGYADVAAGKKVFDAKKCGGCHQTEGPASEKTVADQLKKKGPELWYAGSKFQKAWLAKWLEDPKPIRSLAYNSLTEKNKGDHPKLSGGDASGVADYLMSLTSKDVPAVGITPKSDVKGKLIFTKNMPCSGCHLYENRGQIVGGLTGPSLVGAKDRLNPDWIYAYLKSPKVFKPVKMMPVFEGILTDEQLKQVASFAANF